MRLRGEAMNSSRVINVATDFTAAPGGRFAKHGPFSGEEFRRTILQPAIEMAIRDDAIVEVRLDGAAGYAGSFLEEAFGGLIRAGFSKKDVLAHIRVVANRPRYVPYRELAISYIQSADAGGGKQ